MNHRTRHGMDADDAGGSDAPARADGAAESEQRAVSSKQKRGARRARRRWRGWRWAGGVLVVIVLALVGARLALPWYLQRYVNHTIDQSPDYEGRVGAIDVHLYRGAYTIHDLKINKRVHAVPVPFFESPRVDFSLDWDSLAHGVARGKIRMEKPRLNFVAGPSDEETQTGANQPWLAMIDDLFPFRIDKAEVVDGRVHFQAFHTKPPVNVYLSEVQGTLINLTNVENKVDPLIATAHIKATAMHSGLFEMDLSLDPKSHRPNFELAARLVDLDVTRLNALARAYGDFDFEKGRFDFVLEASTKDGFLEGYAKPLFRHVQVIGLRDIGKDNPLQLLWESLVGLVGAVFKNQGRDQFGTKITLEGDLDNPKMNIMEVVGNVLRNAFVRAYLPRVEGRVAPGALRGGAEAVQKAEAGETVLRIGD